MHFAYSRSVKRVADRSEASMTKDRDRWCIISTIAHQRLVPRSLRRENAFIQIFIKIKVSLFFILIIYIFLALALFHHQIRHSRRYDVIGTETLPLSSASRIGTFAMRCTAGLAFMCTLIPYLSERATRRRRRANSDWPPFEFAAGLHLGDGYRTTRVYLPSLSVSPSLLLRRPLALPPVQSKTHPHRSRQTSLPRSGTQCDLRCVAAHLVLVLLVPCISVLLRKS